MIIRGTLMVIRVYISTYNCHVIDHIISHVIFVRAIRSVVTRVYARTCTYIIIYNGPCGPHALLVFLIAGRWLFATTPRVWIVMFQSGVFTP